MVNLFHLPSLHSECMGFATSITEMYFLFTTHLMEGKIRNAGYGNTIWKRAEKKTALLDVNMLAGVVNPEQLVEGIKTLQPLHDQYLKLQSALAYYRARENNASTSLPLIVYRVPIPVELNCSRGTRTASH